MNTFILSIMLAMSSPQLTDSQLGLISMKSVIGWEPYPGDTKALIYLGLLKPETPTLAIK